MSVAAFPIAGAPIAALGGESLTLAVLFQAEVTLQAQIQRARALAAAFTASISFTAAMRRVRGLAAQFVADVTFLAYSQPILYAATTEFTSNPDDSPGNQPFFGTLQKALSIDRSIINNGGIGQVSVSWAHLELINAEGDYDQFINRYSVDGQPFTLRLGVPPSYRSFVPVVRGQVVDWHVAEDVLTVDVRDAAYLLEAPAQPNTYAGTGALEGGDDLKGKRKPRAFGRVDNATPAFVDPAELVYQINDGPIDEVVAVYDRGRALDFGGDYADSAALYAATQYLSVGGGADIGAGEYATCLAEGLIRLGAAPAGLITMSVKGDATGGYVETTADIVRRTLAAAPQFIPAAMINEPSFAAFDTAQPAPIGYYLGADSDAQVADVVADLLGGVGGWGGFRPRLNRFEIGVFTLAAGAPAHDYAKSDIVSIERLQLPDKLSPPPYRFRVAWGRNWTVQDSDLDGGVSEDTERVAYLKESYRLASAEDEAIRTNHPRAQDPEPIQSYFAEQADAQAEADRQLALWGLTPVSLYSFKVKGRPFMHEIGQVVRLTYPRWDLTEGRLLRIVQLSEDTDDNAVTIQGLG